MSPIIYTRHHCDPAEDPEVAAMSPNESEGVMWQCPDCQSYWETNVRKASDGQVISFMWYCIGRPKEDDHLREVEAALNGTALATTPTITPDMMQIAVNTYHIHGYFKTLNGLEYCEECGTLLADGPADGPDPLTLHARDKATKVLQAQIDAAYKLQHVKVED